MATPRDMYPRNYAVQRVTIKARRKRLKPMGLTYLMRHKKRIEESEAAIRRFLAQQEPT